MKTTYISSIWITLLLLVVHAIQHSSATFFVASKPSNIASIDNEKKELAQSFTVNINSGVNLKEITVWEAFIYFSEFFDVPSSYVYTQVHITWLQKNSESYTAVQKLIYAGVLENKALSISPESKLSSYYFYSLAERFFNLKLIDPTKVSMFKKTITTTNDLEYLKTVIRGDWSKNNQLEIMNVSTSRDLESKQQIFLDVYETLLSSHYDKDNITELELIEAATIWLTKWSDDQFTTYFPPAENKDFMDSLSSDFEWIWSYVEMTEPWTLKIISPIAWSPSEKAWLKWWDTIISVDGKEIEKNHTIRETVSWIKGPKWTTVVLWIFRDGKILEISVVRDTIIIQNVEHKKLNSSTYYIKLVTFWENISGDFEKALSALKSEVWVKKLIIDLRNNPGWYLWEVSNMLGHFVPKWEPTIVVKSLDNTKSEKSAWYKLIDFSNYQVIILQNGWSASAAEIMAGTIKDYLPSATIIGENSYGKWSVQTIKPYSDGSSLKYTIAKWFTGKTQTWIDWVWIPADIELEFDFEGFKKTGVDNQLERALDY